MFHVIKEYNPPLLRWMANVTQLQPTIVVRSFWVNSRGRITSGDTSDGFLCQWTLSGDFFTTRIDVVSATTIEAALTPELALQRLHRSLLLEREGLDAEIAYATARRSVLIQQELDVLKRLMSHKPTEGSENERKTEKAR
jgi:hypothetical protein